MSYYYIHINKKKVFLQYWFYGKLTIDFELDGVNKDYTINDLLYKYWLNIIKPATNSCFTWEYCNPKMDLVRYSNGKQYSKSTTLEQCCFIDGEAFTVLCGFSIFFNNN